MFNASHAVTALIFGIIGIFSGAFCCEMLWRSKFKEFNNSIYTGYKDFIDFVFRSIECGVLDKKDILANYRRQQEKK